MEQQMLNMIIMYVMMPLVTALCTAIITALGGAGPKIAGWTVAKFRPATYSVVITYSTISDSYGRMQQWNVRNLDIINALEWFVAHHCAKTASCDLELRPVPDGVISQNLNEGYKRRELLVKPLDVVTHGDYMIHIVRKKENETPKAGSNNKSDLEIAYKEDITATVYSKRPPSDIGAFIRSCYHKWVDERYPVVPEAESPQYYYTLCRIKDGGLIFKRYHLSNRRGFDDIWFPEKDRLVGLIDDLDNGKLTRLNVLMYGPPGTGKTSTIRAIANKTKRHVFHIKLSLIKTDMTFLDIMHNVDVPFYPHNNEGGHQMYDNVPLKNRIYVFEDIDAECLVVHKRENSPLFDIATKLRNKKLGKKKSAEKKKKSTEKKASPDTSDSESDDELTEMGPVDRMYRGQKMSAKQWHMLNSDSELTLSGILNAFDGVLDLNDTICVLTTNHLDVLDDALVRDGRMDIKLRLDKMTAEDARSMVRKHFSDDAHLDVESGVLEPCRLEAICRASTSVRDVQEKIRLLTN